jgi:cell wall-associated NlpC family hydrolase
MEAFRAALVDQARSWLLTPWHHNACLKGEHGGGVDCGQLIKACYVDAGLVPDFEIGQYPRDWHLHRSEERYLGWVEDRLDRTASPLPGDVAVWKFGRCFSHGAIVVEWPTIIHAYLLERKVCYGDGTAGQLGPPREVRFYTISGRLK